MTTDFISVGAITIICYILAEFVKVSPIDNKWIPTFVAVLGGLLGAVGLYIMPNFPANDIITAVAIGISSGAAATGVNQAFKQLFSK